MMKVVPGAQQRIMIARARDRDGEDTEETWATAEAAAVAVAMAEAAAVATAEAAAVATAEAAVTAVTAEAADTITTTPPPQRDPAQVLVRKCPGTKLAFTCVGCSTS
jgi:hypothetical protein